MHRILINGAWVDSVSGASREIKNPATLMPLGTVPDCGTEDVQRAVAAAKAAQRSWCATTDADRSRLLQQIGERIRARADALAALITQETGTPLCESFDCVNWTAACFERHGEMAGGRSEPCGVAAAISSFSFPLLTMARSVAQAIAAGDTVVCKPPHQNPLASLKLAEICEPLPPGVLNVVTGNADTGAALIEHPDVDSIAFTGNAPLGRQIAAAAGARGKKIGLRLGTVEPIIVLEDAPLDLAVPGIAWARLRQSGQNGASSKRIYVQRSIAAEFADRIHEYMAFLEVGDPLKPDTDLGPLISFEAARRVEDQVAHAAKAGARLKFGGRCYRPWGLPGHFFQPTILTDARHGSVASRENILGPVLLITPVADAAEAMRCASDYGSGLAGSIYTGTAALALEARESFTAGTLEHVSAPKPWWFPYRARKRPAAGSHESAQL